MNVLLNFAGSLLYYIFMFFFLPILAVLLVMLVCHHLVIWINLLLKYASRLATHFHLVRKQMPGRRMARRLAAVHA